MKSITKLGWAAALAAALPAYAQYSAVGLGFEGLQAQGSDAGATVYLPAQILNFYNGGFAKSTLADGTPDPTGTQQGPGPGFGVTFDAEALALMQPSADPNVVGGNGNFGPRYLDELPSNGGQLITTLGRSALYYKGPDPLTKQGGVEQVTLNYTAGFTTGFSFYYASTAQITVTVFSGENGSGSVLGGGTSSTTPTCAIEVGDYTDTYCVWKMIAFDVNGTAKSVRFEGIGEQVLFDNVTFGSKTPFDGAIPVPEPGSAALLALGLAGLGWTVRRRRRA